MLITRNNDYLQKLVETGKRVFRTSEIGLVWSISDAPKLNLYLKRYADRKALYRLARGVYSLVSPSKLHPFELGIVGAGELSYVSLQTVLANHGAISQPAYKITLVGKKSKEFSLGGHNFVCRYLSPKRLVDRQGVVSQDGYAIASLERAVVDSQLIKPKYKLKKD